MVGRARFERATIALKELYFYYNNLFLFNLLIRELAVAICIGPY
jgi:hypothetical protein